MNSAVSLGKRPKGMPTRSPRYRSVLQPHGKVKERIAVVIGFETYQKARNIRVSRNT